MSPEPSPQSNNSDATRDALALTLVTGVGPRLQANLLAAFQTPTQVLNAPTEQLLQVDGIGLKVAERITSPLNRPAANEMRKRCADAAVRLLLKNTHHYPSMLNEVDDSPTILFCKGTITEADQLAIAIVGSRRCTTYGRRQAERLGSALARAGFTIISGLARGIDAAAHRGALNAGGRTIAVMATGVTDIYPPEHADLAVEISKQGAVVSEFPLDQKPRPGMFPQRNRIISGMSLASIIIEATEKSGSLHTARHAMEQGREVFAVPGPIDSIASAGCHQLIRDGVPLIRNADDVIAGLGPLAKPTVTASNQTIHDPRELTLNDQERLVLDSIGSAAIHLDEVIGSLDIEMSRALSTITILEMKRFIRRLPGNLIVRSN